jgi:hypothetical protein
MPTAKALKREASSSNPWWRMLAKWRNLTRRTSSDQPQPWIGFVHEFRALAAAEVQTILDESRMSSQQSSESRAVISAYLLT